MAHFDIENLSFAYPGASGRVLEDVNLSIEQGEYVVLCGKSGCGKTTLLRQLKTVLRPHGNLEGRVSFEGASLDEVSERDQAAKIGFVMQDPDAQVVTDKVWHELAFGLESLGTDQRTMRLRVAEMANYFGIQGWFHKDVRDLSGGQKQLLNLASIMAMQPSVLILDEPTSQLDPIAATNFLNTVRKINLELGTTIILTEHRLEEVFPVADRVVVMDRGRVVHDAAPREVGAELQAAQDDLIFALPAPMRIYYGLNSKSEAKGDTCPLTVREGRGWLSRAYGGRAQGEAVSKPEPAFDGDVADPVIEFKDVWFRYERDLPDVLRDVNLAIPKGVLCAIVGGNGSGKSTLLKASCGVVKPYRGKIKVAGRKLKDWKTEELFRGKVAMLPQDPANLFVKKTVREDLAEMLSAPDEARVVQIAQLTGVGHLLDAHPYDLSGGEQQRAALAKVLLTDPEILLLDEPTKGIDNFFKQRLAEVFSELKSRGVTIVMVSHDVEFCASHADLVSMFFDGSVVTTNTPRRFFAANSFYTTAANRMSRHLFADAVTDEDVIALCSKL